MALMKMVPVEEEMKKNPELKKSDLEMLRKWCEKQPHLPKISDSELALFLHSNYYRLEPSKTTIETFYTVRTHVPEFFSNRDPLGLKELRTAFNVVSYILLPQATSEGYRIVYSKFIDSDSSNYIFNDCVKFLVMMIDIWLRVEGTVPGCIVLLDVDGSTFGHCAKFSPSGLKKLLFYLQEALPVRLKGIHILNILPFVDAVLGMIKPFMKNELLDMLYLHANLESLSKYVPVEALPNEQGGKGGALMDLHKTSLKQAEEHQAWFLQDEKNSRVNENLRQGKGKTATDLFGMEGSFKKLDID